MPRAAQVLRLAAAPTFAVLALLNSGAGTELLCLHAGAPLGGMSLMYGLMCIFHLTPWLGLIARPTR
ncbi:hypothetical protein [Dongia sedimenti]|uniref:Uncharacterized protein n=1 Tax=Dongia sedimenti TaxID=3064282 RepID=A0ABU0YR18_9PROT|nr:hypothetical protein [Rhodospirillaceae bacterium R-7]